MTCDKKTPRARGLRKVNTGLNYLKGHLWLGRPVDGCGCGLGHAVVMMVISVSKSGVSCYIIRTCSS